MEIRVEKKKPTKDTILNAADIVREKQHERKVKAFTDREVADGIAKRRDTLQGNKYWKKSAANRRLVATMPIEVRNHIVDRYGSEVFNNRDRFWEIMNRPENKMFLVDKK